MVLVDHVDKFFIKEVYVIMTRAMGASKKSFFDLGWRPRLGGKFDRGTVVLVVTEDALGWMGKSRTEKSPRFRLNFTKSCQPNFSINRASRVMYVPRSSLMTRGAGGCSLRRFDVGWTGGEGHGRFKLPVDKSVSVG